MTEAITISYKLITWVYKGANRICRGMLYQNESFCKRQKTIHSLMLLLLNPSYFNVTQRLALGRRTDFYFKNCSISQNIFQFKSYKDCAKNSICIIFSIVGILHSNLFYARKVTNNRFKRNCIRLFAERTDVICNLTENHGTLHRAVNTF